MRNRLALLLPTLLLTACSSSAPETDASTLDASSAIDAHTIDASPLVDASSTVDAAPSDAGCDRVCGESRCWNLAACQARTELTPDAPLRDLDTANGTYGDCAINGSGLGGRNLYYALTVPPRHFARITATPTNPTEDALLRVLADCEATDVVTAGRGGGTTSGAATVCVRNLEDAAIEPVVAVGRYEGDFEDRTLELTLSVEVFSIDVGCSP